jgi:4,5-dihydroxyphthalate decarboxylase
MNRLNLSFACWNYDRTRALMDGRVLIDGINLNYLNLPVEETFYRMAKFKEFDVAEMSLSSYCVSLNTPEKPFIAIPVFPSRFFRHSCIFINQNSGIKEPIDLIGKRIASPEYQMTAPVWIRGILSDFYGVPVDAQPYLFGGEEETGRVEKLKLELPKNIQVSPIGPTQTLSQMLYDGDLDALYTARTPSSFLRGDGRITRLFENYFDVERAYFKKTKIFPIMHTVVIRREVYETNRWIAQSLMKAFNASKLIACQDLQETAALKTMLPWLIHHVEDVKKELGDDWWSYGVERNKNTLETFLRYHYEQGLSKKILSIADLFAPESLEEFKI